MARGPQTRVSRAWHFHLAYLNLLACYDDCTTCRPDVQSHRYMFLKR